MLNFFFCRETCVVFVVFSLLCDVEQHVAFLDKPKQTTFSTNASGSVAIAGEYILLKCEVPAGAAKPAVSQYKFYHGVSPSKLLQSSPSGEYVISNIQYKDWGYYKCVATNSAGDGPEQLVAITVKGE